MRIEAYSQIQQIYNTNRTTKTQEKNHVRPTDQLQISSMGRDMQIPLKASIEAGTYHVSTESFADKLFSEYEEMR